LWERLGIRIRPDAWRNLSETLKEHSALRYQ